MPLVRYLCCFFSPICNYILLYLSKLSQYGEIINKTKTITQEFYHCSEELWHKGSGNPTFSHFWTPKQHFFGAFCQCKTDKFFFLFPFFSLKLLNLQSTSIYRCSCRDKLEQKCNTEVKVPSISNEENHGPISCSNKNGSIVFKDCLMCHVIVFFFFFFLVFHQSQCLNQTRKTIK